MGSKLLARTPVDDFFYGAGGYLLKFSLVISNLFFCIFFKVSSNFISNFFVATIFGLFHLPQLLWSFCDVFSVSHHMAFVFVFTTEFENK